MLEFVAGTWYLVPGIHRVSLEEMRSVFVESAPYSEEREEVFDAFRLWRAKLLRLTPTAQLWVNGGFVTHKPWAPPKDVDVVARVVGRELDALEPEAQNEFEGLMTIPASDVHPRIQPIAGLVDGFYSRRSEPDKTIVWRDTWATVLDQNRAVVPGAQKGFLEVTR